MYFLTLLKIAPSNLWLIKITRDAILNVWLSGSEIRKAVANVLFGKVNQSGKCPMTFSRSLEKVLLYYNHKNMGRPLNEEKTDKCEYERFQTNCTDECNTPLYPLGFGSSYTHFTYSEISNSDLNPKGN